MTSSLGKQQAKSVRARDAIFDATIGSLVEVGYAETSLNRVAASAGFSKGALQHHFPSKEDLIAATLDRLLERTFQQPKKLPKTVGESLLIAWKKFVNTPPYRALLEILGAARTDRQLQLRISRNLLCWGRLMDQQAIEVYASTNGEDEEEVVMLLNMTRSFLRGLLIQERYGGDQARNLRYVKKWIELISPYLTLKERYKGKKGNIKGKPNGMPIRSKS